MTDRQTKRPVDVNIESKARSVRVVGRLEQIVSVCYLLVLARDA